MNLLESITTGFASILNSIKAGFDDLKAAMASKTALESQVSELNATIKRQEQEIAEQSGLVAALRQFETEAKSSLAAKDEEIKTLKANQKNVAEQAAEITASQGVKPGALPTSSGENSTDAMVATLREKLKTASATEKFTISMQIKNLLTAKK